jgi:hypothetical protein
MISQEELKFARLIFNKCKDINCDLYQLSLQKLNEYDLSNRTTETVIVKFDRNSLLIHYPFSMRAMNILKHQVFVNNKQSPTFNDLHEFFTNVGARYFMKYRGIGKKTFDEIIESIYNTGYCDETFDEK